MFCTRCSDVNAALTHSSVARRFSSVAAKARPSTSAPGRRATGTRLARARPVLPQEEPPQIQEDANPVRQEPRPIRPRRWPTERPLLILNAFAAAGLWFLFLRSFQSMAFLAPWLGIVFLMNVAFVTAIRGSAVRLGPDQFPELHGRVE